MPAQAHTQGATARLASCALVTWLCLQLAGCGGQVEIPHPSRSEELDPEVFALIEEHVASVRERPEDARAHGTLGLVYEANELWDPASACFETASELAPEKPLWDLHRAICLGALGEANRALECLERVAARLPDDPAVFHRLGQAQFEAGQFARAETSFRKAQSLAPSNPEPLAGLGRTLLSLERDEEARAVLQQAIALDPSYRSAHHALGLALAALGEEAASRRELELGEAAQPRFLADALTVEKQRYAVGPEERIRRGVALITRGDYAGAIALLEPAALERPRDEPLLGNLAWAYVGSRQHEKARDIALQVLEFNEDSYKAHVMLVFANLGLEQIEQALVAAQRALELAPEAADAHYAMARVLGECEDFDGARAAIQQAISLDNRDLRFPTYLGSIETRSGRHLAARAVYEQILVRIPGHANTHANLAEALLVLGEFDAARAEIQTLRELAPGHPRIPKLEQALELFTR